MDDSLIGIARSKFGELTRCEETLLRACIDGDFAYGGRSGDNCDPANNPAQSDKSSTEHETRAQLISWLCTGREATEQVHFKGVQLYGARINGELDLAGAHVPFPLTFANCAFTHPLLLIQTHVPSLVLTGTWVAYLNAEFLSALESVFLERIRAVTVRLGGAKIGADLNCSGAILGAPKATLASIGGYAFFADRAKVGGNIILSNHSRVEGRVSFIGAALGGDLVCSDSAFFTPDDTALNCDSINLAGSAIFRGSHVNGQVRLAGANVGGDLDCNGAVFENPGSSALFADQAKVGGTAFFMNRFKSDGEIRLLGADLGALCCSGGAFTNSDSRELTADGARIARDASLSNGFCADGEVRLIGGTVGAQFSCDGGTFNNPGRFALILDGTSIAGGALLRKNFRVDGQVRFVGANLQSLEVSEAQFAQNSGVDLSNAKINRALVWARLAANNPASLNLAHASAGVIADDEHSWPSKGKLCLDGFHYEHIAGGPRDARERLKWLDRQPEGFSPQPYHQLSKVLRTAGDDSGARAVLISMENCRHKYGRLGRIDWLLSWILRLTIGYGYAPFRALWYIAAFVLLGTFVFGLGARARLIGPAEKEVPSAAGPFNPLIYSLENFLPLVDLHQKQYWLPDPNRCQQRPLALLSPLVGKRYSLGSRFGRFLRAYLWIHILAGWFFTSMFVAGVTGLVKRN